MNSGYLAKTLGGKSALALLDLPALFELLLEDESHAKEQFDFGVIYQFPTCRPRSCCGRVEYRRSTSCAPLLCCCLPRSRRLDSS